MTSKEGVDTIAHAHGECNHTICTLLTIENTNEIRKIIKNRQIVFDTDDVVAVCEKLTDACSGLDSLADIEVRRGLINHIHICLLDSNEGNAETLQFTSRKFFNTALKNTGEIKILNELIHLVTLALCSKMIVHCSMQHLLNLVNILGFNNSLEMIFKHLCEVILEFTASEVCENILPIWRIAEFAKIWLQLSCKNS